MNIKSKKILYLITLAEWGGAQKYILDLASFFKAQKNYQVAVALGGKPNDELIKRLKALNIQTYYIAHLQRSVNFYHDFLAWWQIRSIYRKFQPTIVHLNSSKAGALGAMATVGYRKKINKVIYTIHGLILNEPLSFFKKTFYCLAEYLSAILKTDLICVSEFDKRSVIQHKISKPAKITVIHNGLKLATLNFFDKAMAKEKLIKISSYKLQINITELQAENCKLIGTIANFYPTKGLTYLIQAAQTVCNENPQTKFIIIGDGPGRRELTELIIEHQLENKVLLLGTLNQARQYIKAFDIFVLPSVKEGLPYTLIEAQAAGMPTIATSVGGNPEIIQHNQNGILIPPANPQALAESIIKLFKDKKLQQRFSQASLIQATNFSLRAMLTKTQQVYEK